MICTRLYTEWTIVSEYCEIPLSNKVAKPRKAEEEKAAPPLECKSQIECDLRKIGRLAQNGIDQRFVPLLKSFDANDRTNCELHYKDANG